MINGSLVGLWWEAALFSGAVLRSFFRYGQLVSWMNRSKHVEVTFLIFLAHHSFGQFTYSQIDLRQFVASEACEVSAIFRGDSGPLLLSTARQG